MFLHSSLNWVGELVNFKGIGMLPNKVLLRLSNSICNQLLLHLNQNNLLIVLLHFAVTVLGCLDVCTMRNFTCNTKVKEY